MKIAALDIAPGELVTALNSHYSLGITTLRFIPKGEDAYAYTAQSADGTRHFIRAQPGNRARDLAAAYSIVATLHNRCGLSGVIAPYPTQQDSFAFSFGTYTVAAFPFIEGSTLYERGAAAADLSAAAQLLAALHNSSQCAGPLPYRETFDNPFAPAILHALSSDPAMFGPGYQREATLLLQNQRSDILATLARMTGLQRELAALPLSYVLTHGDPNLDNLLKDRFGVLHLSDWGELAAGPAERDLAAFSGENFETFLQAYAAARGPLSLHTAAFTFYSYRWTMQEIADYSTRLLMHASHPIEQEHAWRELQDYLPIHHAGISASVARVAEIISRVLETD